MIPLSHSRPTFTPFQLFPSAPTNTLAIHPHLHTYSLSSFNWWTRMSLVLHPITPLSSFLHPLITSFFLLPFWLFLSPNLVRVRVQVFCLSRVVSICFYLADGGWSCLLSVLHISLLHPSKGNNSTTTRGERNKKINRTKSNEQVLGVRYT